MQTRADEVCNSADKVCVKKVILLIESRSEASFLAVTSISKSLETSACFYGSSWSSFAFLSFLFAMKKNMRIAVI